MKEHIISYVLADEQWWCGLNITNHSEVPTDVGITYYAANGSMIKSDVIHLEPRCMKRFLVDVPYGWARAISGDGVTILEFMGDQKSSMAVPIEQRILPDADPIN